MPSLKALDEFKVSFHNIANEKNDVTLKKMPFDDLALPATEASSMDFPGMGDASAGSSAASAFTDDSAGSFAASAGTDTADSGFDFNAFLNTLPADVGPPPMGDLPSIEDLIQDTPSVSEVPEVSGVSEVSEVSGVSGVSDEWPETSGTGFDGTETAPLDSGFGDFPADDTGFGDFGTGDFQTDDLSSESTDTDEGTEFTASGFDDLGFPDDSGTDDFNADDDSIDLDGGSIDLGGESIDLGGEAPSSGIEDSGEFDSGLDSPLPEGDDLLTEDFDSGFDTPLPAGDDLDSGFDSPLPEGEDLFTEGLSSDFDSPLPEGDDFSDQGFGSDFDSPLPEGDDLGSDFDSPLPAGDDLGSDFDSPLPEGDDLGSDFDSPLPAGDDLGSDFDSPLPDADFSGMDFSSDFDTGETPLDTNFDTGSELELASEGGAPEKTEDFGSDFESDSIELGGDSDLPGGGDMITDEFSLPGLEDIFEKTKTETIIPAAPKKGFFKRRKVVEEEPEPESDIEEIQLTKDDLEKLLRTLNSYPLNLRIACQEMIAEQVLLPQQLSKLIRLLIVNAHVKETAALVEEVTGKQIVIPKSFEKMTGAAFEAEQSSFAYIFVHNFLPVLKLFAFIVVMAASVLYLGYRFIYIPIRAENLYKRGYERIPAGEYQRANQLFNEAFLTQRKKKWFYLYAEAFRDQRRFLLAEEKYDELLLYYPRDKKGVLDYARLNTYYLLNYDKANRLLQNQLLDYTPDDQDGLLAAGDNFLLWADSDPARFYDRYEDARFSYARIIEKYGQLVPVMERMMKYFIRTDNLREVIHLRTWFESSNRRRLSASSLAELGGYLLDKQLATAAGEVRGVPDPFVESIESVRAMLLQAVREEPTLPEPHYHLARYHKNLGNTYEERLTLENAIRAFDLAQTETVPRRINRIDTHYRYSNLLVENREFFPAEEQLVRGIQLYEDFVARNLMRPTPQLGQLYAAKGNLEYFVKSGNMRAALNDYRIAERYGYAPPEILYRMGAAYYQIEDWRNALEYLFKASFDLPLNRRLLYALGNAAYQRGDYFAAEGYYSRLLDILENQRIRMPMLLPNDNQQFLELGERLMMARNNAGVIYEALAEQTGNRDYRSRALALYAESARAWDSITRDPATMTRMRLMDSPGAPGINLGYLNANNALRPSGNYRPEVFIRIDKDVLEPSRWEELAPFTGLQ